MDFLLVAKVLVCLFFAVLFLQSGFDKVTDWKGNLAWLTGHFSKTMFAKTVPLLLATVTLLELASGFLCLGGAGSILFKGPYWIPQAGLTLCLVSLLMLFTGQRIAKDYAGAATLASYFGVTLLGLWLISTN